MIIKALAGGGGRGTRVVLSADELDAAFLRCQSEADAAFGRAEVYVEEFLPRVRHVEVQILGDEAGVIEHLGERECSIQRRLQKIVEIAPAPALDDRLREAIIDAAVRFAKHVGYTNLGTFEFLVDVSAAPALPFVFIEANARLQVEHTFTEAVTGVDLVQAQIRLAQGATLKDLGLDGPGIARPRGYAIQTRVNMESIGPDGSVRPRGGTLTVYEAPNGPGVRTDGFGYAGYRTSAAFDSLLAKVIVQGPDFAGAVGRSSRALSEFRLEGVATNIAFLRNILAHADFAAGNVHTRWVDENMAALAADGPDRRRRFVEAVRPRPTMAGSPERVNSRDPLALFAHDAQVKAEGAAAPATTRPSPPTGPDGSAGSPPDPGHHRGHRRRRR
jgi:pyruvate carboxylase